MELELQEINNNYTKMVEKINLDNYTKMVEKYEINSENYTIGRKNTHFTKIKMKRKLRRKKTQNKYTKNVTHRILLMKMKFSSLAKIFTRSL